MSPNKIPLSPLSFLDRAADVFPDGPAVHDTGRTPWTYAEFRAQAVRLATSLARDGIRPGDRVAILARNIPEMLVAHYGVPAAGAVLVPLNIRLAASEYAYILRDSGAKVLLVDPVLAEVVAPVVEDLDLEHVVVLPRGETDSVPEATLGGSVAYTGWLAAAPADSAALGLPEDEDAPIALNYTSGTTGRPKGAIYTHRGAYLNSMGLALQLRLTADSVYLWTLPMFHCNGWCFTWAVTAVGAQHVCLGRFEPETAWEVVDRHGVTHLCGAPIVLSDMARHGEGRRTNHEVVAATGGAPPAPSVISSLHEQHVEVVHLYGLTETYGPCLVCEIRPSWRNEEPATFARLLSRQGVRTINVDRVRVVDAQRREVAADGEQMGELQVRSNTVMAGYHGDGRATAEAMDGGWLRTGDLAVLHPDGYVELRDRSKDIIISGGENVSSIEVENVLMEHPDVAEAAVVGRPDDRWGEVPVAFVSRRPGSDASEDDLIAHVRGRLAGFKTPRQIVFDELPKTSTGKTQKFELRRRVGGAKNVAE